MSSGSYDNYFTKECGWDGGDCKTSEEGSNKLIAIYVLLIVAVFAAFSSILLMKRKKWERDQPMPTKFQPHAESQFPGQSAPVVAQVSAPPIQAVLVSSTTTEAIQKQDPH